MSEPSQQPELEQAEDSTVYLLWSWNHCMWWRADGDGYTRWLFEAGVYSAERVRDRRDHAIPVERKVLEEIQRLSRQLSVLERPILNARDRLADARWLPDDTVLVESRTPR